MMSVCAKVQSCTEKQEKYKMLHNKNKLVSVLDVTPCERDKRVFFLARDVRAVKEGVFLGGACTFIILRNEICVITDESVFSVMKKIGWTAD